MIDSETVAHELALEYVKKTDDLSPQSTPAAFAQLYLSALEEIRQELDCARQQKN